MAKKKLRGSSIQVSMSKALVKKSSRTLGKHSGSSGSKSKSKSKSKTNSRGSDGDVVTYGVVPSEYNIQAQIDWLTAPPSEKSKSTVVSQPPPSKKPQRGFHRDVCEACGEGDCLMYCDKCPSAYHAICDDPPLPPEDFETIGINWKCKKCRIQAAGIDKSKIDFPKTPNEGPITKFFRQCLPFQIAQNPVQFKLSKEMPAYDYPFPGTSRHILKKGRQRTSVVEVENGMVPRPTVLCFHCKRSCRIGALIQCDKCDTFFHLDCLDPPLTTIPATVWLCPLHVEPYLESTQLTTVALSERIKIWDNSEKPVNRSAVILNFLRKGARRNPMFRRKMAITMTPSIEIPEMVMNCYKQNGDNDAYVKENFGKMQTLVAACEIERVKFSMEQEVHKYRTKWIDHYLPAGKQLVEQRARVDRLKSRNESKLEQIHQIMKKFEEHVEEIENSLPEPPPPPKPKLSDLMSGFFKDTTLSADMEKNDDNPIPCTSTGTKLESNDEAQKDEIQNEDDSQPAPLPANNIMFGEVPDWLLEELKEAETDINEDIKSLEALKNDVEHVGDILLQFPLTPEDYSKGIAEIMSSKGMRTSWNFDAPFPFQPTPSFKLTRPVTPPRFRPKESIPLQMDLIKSLPRKTVNKLAAFHLRRMRRKRELGNFFPPKNDVHKISSTHSITGPRPLISFFIENTGINIEITKRNFWVGSGNESDWKITDYVKCNRISDKHAKIFFNPHEHCWEILNYSPHGIYVNHTLFGFKGSEADSTTAPPVSERFLELHEKSMKRMDEYILKHGSDLKVYDPNPCFCKPFPAYAMTNIFEGSVKLAVGHRLQIGCAKLTIAKFATVND